MYFLLGCFFMNKPDIKKISVVSMLTAVAFLCTFVFRFKVAFLTFDFKDAVISIISLVYGPLWAVVSSGLVAFFEMLSMSDTGLYGMIMNFLSSGTFALTCGIVYKYKRSFSGAIFAVIASAVSVTSVMMLANIFITPHYIGATSADVIALIPTLLLPFNLSKAVINSAVVLIIYKPVTMVLKKIGLIKKSENDRGVKKRSLALLLVSLIVIILTALFLILYMGGSFELFRS